ncbi:M56 family metallopeptidase [Cognatilysobacter tabacisoli]|uniref:M56 family metallopeptidase n=1 Tax=Cognatilysobacter tabacisoli TaxID=2315424 RepID=UPI000E6B4659|nr:M56 family metallopeptidase [Lysobacter tabacisoli]
MNPDAVGIAALPGFDAAVRALGWTLLHFVWQGAVVGALAAASLALLRNARPQARYAVACAALALCVAWPAWQFAHELSLARAGAAPLLPPDQAGAAAARLSPVLPTLSGSRPDLQDRLPWIVGLWSLGASLLVLRLFAGLAWVGRLGRATPADTAWQQRLDGLARRIGLDRAVTLRIGDDGDGPLAAGWWRPIVVVPAALLARLPTDLVEALLAHELAHIRRHDYLVNLVQHAVEALLFYHPVVWWLSRAIRVEREQIADDLAAGALADPRRLARALHELDRFRANTPGPLAAHPAPAAQGGHLMSRIQRLLRPAPTPLNWRFAVPLLGACAVCVVAYAQTRPQPAAPSAAINMRTAPLAITATTASVTTTTTATGSAVSSRDDGGYAVVRAGRDGLHTVGSDADRAEVERWRSREKGDFVWARRGDRRYLIRDPAVLARIDAAWQPIEPLHQQMRAFEQRMAPHEAQMESLARRMEALAASHEPDTGRLEALHGQIEALGEEQAELGEQMEQAARTMAGARDGGSEADVQAYQRQVAALQAQMLAKQEAMRPLMAQVQQHSNRMVATAEPMAALGREMEAASKPMQALGEQAGALGARLGEMSREADEKSRALIDEAIASGKAEALQ